MYSDVYNLENIRIENLIFEREAYENNFISFKDIEKSDEMDLQISFHANHFGDLSYEYDCYENSHELTRDEWLIRQRETHEQELFNDLEFDIIDSFEQARDEYLIEKYYSEIDLEAEFESDALDYAISQYESDNNYDFEDYIECCNYYDYVDYDACYEADRLRGYVPNTDPFDSLDGCDYPEGPDENLEGFRYPEVYECLIFYDYDELDYDYVDYEDIQAEIYLTEVYETLNNEEIYLNQLIDEHLNEEKQFYEFARKNEISNEEVKCSYAEDINIH